MAERPNVLPPVTGRELAVVLKARPSSPTKLDYRDVNFEVSWLARLRLCDLDTKRLIAGARREIATSYALLAEIDRILALR